MSDPVPQAIDLGTVERVLIVAVPGIGDTLLATPIVSSLLARKPGLTIDFLVRKGRAGLVAACPGICEVIEYDYDSAVGSYLRMMRQLFRRYDLAVSTSASDRSVMAAFCAAPRRYSLVPPFGWTSFWKHWAVARPLVRDDSIPVTELNLRLVDQMGLPRVGDFILPSDGGGESAPGRAVLTDLSRPYAVVHGMPREVYKEWPMESWVDVVEHLRSRGLHVYLAGGPAGPDIQFNATLSSCFDHGVTSLAGQLGFAALAELLRGCQVYVGADTVTSHLAAAIGIPVVVIFGPINHLKWGPVAKAGANREVFDHPRGARTIGNVTLCKADCQCPGFPVQCERHQRPQSLCLEELEPAEVIAAIEGVGGD